MTQVRKTILTITVLHPADETPEGMELSDIMYEIDNGGWLGMIQTGTSQDVPDDKLCDECLALGNDGSFFDFDE